MFLDIVTGLVVAYGIYQGFTNGLVKTVFSTLSLVIGIVAALKLSPITIGILQNALNVNPGITFVLGFVLTFVLVMILVQFIGGRIDNLMESIHIGWVNKLLGGALLGLFYAVLISFAVFFMDKVALISDDAKTASYAYPLLEPLPKATKGIGESVRPMFTEFWDKMMETMDTIKEKGDELNG